MSIIQLLLLTVLSLIAGMDAPQSKMMQQISIAEEILGSLVYFEKGKPAVFYCSIPQLGHYLMAPKQFFRVRQATSNVLMVTEEAGLPFEIILSILTHCLDFEPLSTSSPGHPFGAQFSCTRTPQGCPGISLGALRVQLHDFKALLEWIAELPKQITCFDFSQIILGQPELSALCKLSGLLELRLFNCDLSSDFMNSIKELKNLEVLSITVTTIGDDGLAQLLDLPNLVSLDLNWCNISESGAQEIAKLTSLQHLDLSDNGNIQDGLYPIIRGLKNLRSFKVTGCPLTDEHLILLSTELKAMKVLHIGATLISDVGCMALMGLTELEDIDIAEDRISYETCQALFTLPKLKTLCLTWDNVTLPWN